MFSFILHFCFFLCISLEICCSDSMIFLILDEATMQTNDEGGHLVNTSVEKPKLTIVAHNDNACECILVPIQTHTKKTTGTHDSPIPSIHTSTLPPFDDNTTGRG